MHTCCNLLGTRELPYFVFQNWRSSGRIALSTVTDYFLASEIELNLQELKYLFRSKKESDFRVSSTTPPTENTLYVAPTTWVRKLTNLRCAHLNEESSEIIVLALLFKCEMCQDCLLSPVLTEAPSKLRYFFRSIYTCSSDFLVKV